jgi:hypothetical protein
MRIIIMKANWYWLSKHLMPKFKAHFLVNFDQLKKDYLDQHIDLDKS